MKTQSTKQPMPSAPRSYDFVEAYMDHHARGVPADQGAASELIEEDTKAAEARLVEASAALKLAISTALRAK